jgi:hypothetical protein
LIAAFRFGFGFTEFPEELIRAPGFIGIDLANGEADVDHDIVAERSFRDEIEIGLARDAGEIDIAESIVAYGFDVYNSTGDGQTHDGDLCFQYNGETGNFGVAESGFVIASGAQKWAAGRYAGCAHAIGAADERLVLETKHPAGLQ